MASEVKFLKGMNKDTARIDQIDGTFRDALNAVIDSDKGAITSEQGNSFVARLQDPASGRPYNVVGQIALPNDDFLVFGIHPITTTTSVSGIFYIDTSASTSRLLYSTTVGALKGHLAFDIENPITGEFRLSPLGEVIVYFTDNKFTETTEPNTGIKYISQYNPPRVFNVTRQIEYLDSGGVETNLYSVTSADVSILNLFMDSGRIPEFKSLKILQGGGVESGTYYLGVAYADKDFTETNVLTLSNPVYIVPSPENTIPREIISGSPNEYQTNKSIKWILNNVNPDYKYVVPYIIQRVGNAEFAYKLEAIEINTGAIGGLLANEVEIVYSGLENAAQSSLDEAVIDKVKFLTAKSLTQLDNKLYAANLTARKDLGFQRFANSIKLNAKVETIGKDALGNGAFDPRVYDEFNLNNGYASILHVNLEAPDKDLQYILSIITPVQKKGSKAYRDVEELLYKKKTYRRGEVYSFYISFILKDGGESYAYHIPGRNVSATGGPPWAEWEDWERKPLTINIPSSFNPGEILASNPTAKIYQYLDTSIATGLSMGYWENENEFYPNTDDFDIWSVDNSGNPVQTGSMRGTKVRHHKMPSNHNILYSHIIPNVDYSTPNVSASGNSVTFEESVRILGVELSDIRIPKFILSQIQGYKVYYAKRTQGNKTIIGQSGLHPGNLFLAANLSNKRSLAAMGPFYNLYYMVGVHTTDNIYVPTCGWSVPARQLQGVFKFHDFNLLRKKHTLATVTHVDLQYVVTMQHWRGGYKGANGYTPGPASNGTINTFRAGRGDDEHAWVHPDLNNTINFEEPDPNNANYIIEGPTGTNGNVLIGAVYNEIGRTGIDVGVSVGGVTTKQDCLSYYQCLFTIDADSATYLAGLSYLKNASATAFKGATYLVNDSGESAIALGMTSGIPPLAGYGSGDWAESTGNTSLKRVSGGAVGIPVSIYIDDCSQIGYQTALLNYSANPFEDGKTDFFLEVEAAVVALGYNGAGQPGVNNGDITYQVLLQGGAPQDCNFLGFSCAFTWNGTIYKPSGTPNTYLTNLCSAKTDVFEPFDQQQLISTGYYKSTLEVNTNTGLDAFDGTTNYYSGATSDVVFGGDTFICRYGYRTTSQSFGFTWFRSGSNEAHSGTLYGDIPLDVISDTTGGVGPILGLNLQQRENTIGDVDNWQRGDVSPITSIYQYIVESDDNINFRHCGDVEAGVSPAASVYFDKYTAADVLYKSPLYDLTKMDNLLYEDQYSAQQDKRVTVPYPKKERSTNLYPNRIIRSNTQDGNFNDAYRAFLGFQYKDFGQNKGAITNIFNLNALIYIHTEKSLFKTKGKQTMELGDSSQAYVGSGDLFAQEPDEFVQSSEGHLGSYNKLGSLVTKDGYVFVSRKTRKIFLVGQKVIDLSEVGLGTWSRDFIPFVVENYGLDLDALNINQDAPTGRFGFLVTYDPLFKRTIITKRELVPTDLFLSQFASGDIYYNSTINSFYSISADKPIGFLEGFWFKKSGWTISFSNDFTVWASRHSYIPPMYAYNSKYLFSFDPSNPSDLFKHHDYDNPGRFYNSIYNFEFEFIYTGETTTTTSGAVSSTKAVNKIFTSISYVADVFRKEATSLRQYDNKFDTGFTSFFVYNTTQNSSEIDFSYLSNIRKTDNTWVTNAFRDLSAISFNTNMAQGQINVHGDLYTGTYTTSNTETMFLSEGVINPNYLDLNKAWYDQRKFVDKFLGIRLISNNQAKNLINLYTAKAAYRTSNR